MDNTNNTSDFVFSLEDAIIIDNILSQNGFNRNLRIFDSHFKIFSKEELTKASSARIDNIKDIKILSIFPNLKRLEIKHDNYENMYYYDSDNEEEAKEEYHFINMLTNLEELIIENDTSIEYLDVTNLTNLKVLKLFNNPSLKIIKGLDNKNFLDKVIMYGNNIKEFSNFDDYLINTISASENIIDSSIYLSTIKSISAARKLNDLYIRGLINVKFSEKNGLTKYSVLEMNQMTELYIKLTQLFNKYKVFDMDESSKIKYVFGYILRNVGFASSELNERNKFCSDLLNKYNHIPEFYNKNIGSVHNSYYTFHFKKGNCEGIVNLMNTMLSILGIDSTNVHCYDRRGKYSLSSNHALLRIKRENKFFYYDATYDRKNPNNFYEKTYTEVLNYVDLNMYEIKLNLEGDRLNDTEKFKEYYRAKK